MEPTTTPPLIRPVGPGRAAEEATGLDVETIASELEPKGAEEILEWAIETFQPRLAVACSFQVSSSVIVDIVHRIDPTVRFVYLDTDVLFPETYETRDALAERYGIEFERFHNLTLEEQAERFGDELWKRNPDVCCGIRKVDPMRDALTGMEAWVSGIRREQSQTRAGAPKFSWDRRFGLYKLNPLADWSEKDVWRYVSDRSVPYNPLHDRGYASIGCTHCTRPVSNGDGPRDGRWADADKIECGLHD
jgi:phosphoadenosine phosphosulfate reductase